MVEKTKLPQEIRTCPKCGAGMVAMRASRGDGRADAGLRYLFCCQICHHEEVLETKRSENLTLVASGFLVLSGALVLNYGPLPYQMLLGPLFLILGGSSLWFSWRSARAYRPKRGNQSVTETVEVEEEFLIKGVDAKRQHWMHRYGSYLIFGILIVSTFVLLKDWLGA